MYEEFTSRDSVSHESADRDIAYVPNIKKTISEQPPDTTYTILIPCVSEFCVTKSFSLYFNLLLLSYGN